MKRLFMYLPPKNNIFETANDDPLKYHYCPIIGYVYKKRLKNTLSLLGNGYARVLDIGYGSGILFPELSRRAQKVYGLETHGQEKLVQEMLGKEEVNNVILKSGSILEIPFEDNFFDAIVSVSTLEHINDLDKAMSEIKRAIKPGGDIVLSFPARNIITDSFFRIVGYNPRRLHPSSHKDIIKAINKYFEIIRILAFPRFGKALYFSVKCKKND